MTETPPAGTAERPAPAGHGRRPQDGTSPTVDGLTRATNNVGLIQLPDGRWLAVAVFVSDSHADTATRERYRTNRAGRLGPLLTLSCSPRETYGGAIVLPLRFVFYAGEVSEWPKEQHWKCCMGLKPHRGFESLPLR